MMQHTVKKDNVFIRSGTVIKGKWNNNEYVVMKEIGAGMIGTVYLCRQKKRYVALKISEQAMSLTTEVNVLKSLSKVQDNRLGPFLLDVDDWEVGNGEQYSFYVMEYINGVSMEKFVKDNGPEWIGPLLIQMLEKLEKLHEAGWVFGDLKNDNILIMKSPPTVRFIDVGGTTRIGRSVKEYSEFYDQAYWQLGTRRAQPSYDLFALAMVILTLYYPKQFKRMKDSKRLIFGKIAEVRQLHIYERILQRAVVGHYKKASDMKSDMLQMIIQRQVIRTKKQVNKGNYLTQAIIIACLSGFYFYIGTLFLY